MNDQFVIGGQVIAKRSRQVIELELPPLYVHSPLTMPVHVLSRSKRKVQYDPFIARSSSWVRASESGLFRNLCAMGSRVKRGDVIGIIDDPFGREEFEVIASVSGIIIGCSEIPLVHEGEALFHIARFEDIREVAGSVESFQTDLEPEGNNVISLSQEEPPIV